MLRRHENNRRTVGSAVPPLILPGSRSGSLFLKVLVPRVLGGRHFERRIYKVIGEDRNGLRVDEELEPWLGE